MKTLRNPLALLALLLLTLLAGCHQQPAQTAPVASAPPRVGATLNILAGSELKDLDFLELEMEQAAGASIKWTYTGTLDMVDTLNGSDATAYDLAWAASGKYLSLAAAGKVKTAEKIMLSPVILGVKASSAKRLGWDHKDPTWAEVAQAAKAGSFSYGMTNPTASNSGFCAVVGVAAALSGKGDGLTAADIQGEKLRQFFSGQKLTAGSSGWLADAYAKTPAGLDGLINYESVILSLNAGGSLAEPLVPVYPSEGIITSDYPLMLLNPARREAYERLVAFLKTDEVQNRIMLRTHRRPVTPTVKPAAEFGNRLLIELPFPGNLDVLDALLTAYQDELRRPGHTYFVLDTSGSMQGARIHDLREGLEALTSGGPGSSRFSRFTLREKVDLITFSSKVKTTDRLDFGSTQQFGKTAGDYRQFVDGLKPDGGTAIYDAVLEAYRRAAKDQKAEPDRYYTIVLMTDGANNEGASFGEFRALWDQLGDVKSVRVFPILFGESRIEEMKALAELTGGRTFDGRTESLTKVFREIRAYQ